MRLITKYLYNVHLPEERLAESATDIGLVIFNNQQLIIHDKDKEPSKSTYTRKEEGGFDFAT